MHQALRSLLLSCALPFSAVAAAPQAPVGDAALQALYGGVVPDKSVPFNTLAHSAIILPDTQREEWPALRERIHRRVFAYSGTGPVPLAPAPARFEQVETYRQHDLTHIRYRYHIVDDIWGEAIAVLPEKFQHGSSSAAVLTIHGTNGKAGKQGPLGAPGTRRAYATELAKRGYVAFSPDLFGYGSFVAKVSEGQLVADLLKKYPDWSYRGIKLLSLIRAVDVMEQLPFISKGAYGSMGNSLGGGMALFHAAVDPRIRVSVPSTGVSPAATNIYRLAERGRTEEPLKWKKIAADGKSPYDVHDVIALCAPRAMLFLEPFNDPYNPDTAASFNAIHQAMQVYQLLGVPGRISVLVHGDGHDTVDDVREYAYRWFDRYLLNAPGR